jgi:rare lipoprotein A
MQRCRGVDRRAAAVPTPNLAKQAMTPRTFASIAVGTALLAATTTATAQNAAAPAAATPRPTAAPAAGTERGKLAWYGSKFTGRKTASGQRYDPNALTMAHKTLPFGTRVKVTNLANQRSVELKVNDRGPTQADRIGDVSYAAARRLGMVRAGVIDAEVTVLAAPAAKKS